MKTYLIASDTIYNIENKLKDLKKDIKNIIVFNLEENTINEVLEEASYLSMFDDEKCIIVKNAKMFGTNKQTEKIKEDLEKIIKYIENENKKTTLIFILNGKADSKKKIYKMLSEAGNVFVYNTFSKTDIKNEIDKLFKENGYKISDDSLWHIVNNTLGNMDLAINEAKKIIMYYGEKCVVNYKDVVELTSKNIEDNNFKLVDNIIKKDLDLSLKSIMEAKVLKIEPTVIISLLYREFKLMLSASVYKNNKYSYNEILSKLGLADWQYKKIEINLKNYTLKEIEDEIINLSIIDYKLKSGLINKDTILIDYVLNLCS